jgi:predicted ArsR family transcriptional regulator
VLAQAIVADGPASTTRRTAQQLARERGQALGERVRTGRRLGRLGAERALTLASELLAACGYAPARAATQPGLVLGNCPFRQLARRAALLRYAEPGRAVCASSVLDQIVLANSSKVTATLRFAGASTASS